MELIHAFSSQRRNMSFTHGRVSSSLENRRRFLGDLGIDSGGLVCAKQVHGDRIYIARQSDKGSGALTYASAIADTDAFLTCERNLALAIFTADCLSIFIYDPVGGSIGLVHAGWRGSAKKIALKTVKLMQKEFNAKTEDLRVSFGPLIKDCCYEVGPEFRSAFSSGVKERNKSFYLDLAQINKGQLLDSGVRGENISDPGICTFCSSKDFFSFRREGNSCGRMMSVIMMK